MSLCIFFALFYLSSSYSSFVIVNPVPSNSTGRNKLAGQGQLKNKQPKDPSKRHYLFKRRYG